MKAMRDRFGQWVAGADTATLAGIDRFGDELLSHGKEAGCILAAAEASPDCLLAQAYAAAVYLFLQTAEGRAKARPWLDRGQRALDTGAWQDTPGGERERLTMAAIQAWGDGDADQALRLHCAIATAWPRDLVNLKIAQIHQLNRGDRAGMRQLASAALPHAESVSYVHGLLAFALEQVGELDGAERHGRQCVAMNENDPWGQHAVAHVLEARGDWAAGVRFLDGLTGTWDRCSSFMYTHNWWHLALFRLALGDSQGALDLFDTRVWGVRKTYVQDQVNAIALISRLELQGVEVGDRWADVAAYVQPRLHDRENAFLDLHYIYAMARAGRDTDVSAMLQDLSDWAAAAPGWNRHVWQDVALPAARAMVGHARGQWRAASGLGRLLPQLHKVGGSTAQQDWFRRLDRDARLHLEIGSGGRTRCQDQPA